MSGLVVDYADGRSVANLESYEAAVEEVESAYPNAEIGHDGDLSEGGDRTLCWASEADSIDDDGAHAVATIRVQS